MVKQCTTYYGKQKQIKKKENLPIVACPVAHISMLASVSLPVPQAQRLPCINCDQRLATAGNHGQATLEALNGQGHLEQVPQNLKH